MVTYYFYCFFKAVLGREHSEKVSKKINGQLLFLMNHLNWEDVFEILFFSQVANYLFQQVFAMDGTLF